MKLKHEEVALDEFGVRMKNKCPQIAKKKKKSSGNLHANLTFCVCEMGFSALKNIKTGKNNDYTWLKEIRE